MNPSYPPQDDSPVPKSEHEPTGDAEAAAAAYARAQGSGTREPEAPTGNVDGAADDQDAGGAPSDAGEALAELRAENEQLRGQMLRALADMENLRRRTAREKEDAAKFAINRFAKDLLSVADNLRRAIQAIPLHSADDNDLMRTLADGVVAVERELAAVVERHGVRPVEALGQPFDSNVHEAVMEQPTDAYPPGCVAEVFQIGYLLNDRLLRPAMVAVAKPTSGDSPAAAGDNAD